MSLKIRIKSKELPLPNKRKPRMKLIVRTRSRQLAKKPSSHCYNVKAHCKTKLNLGTNGNTVNNYKVQLGDDISHKLDVTQLRVSINRSIGLKIPDVERVLTIKYSVHTCTLAGLIVRLKIILLVSCFKSVTPLLHPRDFPNI